MSIALRPPGIGDGAPALGGALGERVAAPPETTTPKLSFSDLLGDAVKGAAEAGQVAAAQADAVAVGKLDDLHGTLIAAKKAEITLKLTGAIRNKLLDAFHELWRTSV
jgi:flagellar hook-basal body complex protein FliE